MITQTIISAGQSLVDVAIQELGSVEALFDLAAANGLAITDVLTPGQTLTVPASLLARPEIASYFRQRGQRINTANATTVDGPVLQPDGIFDDTYADPFN